MKTASFIASAVLLSTSFSFAGGEGWVHDFEAAKKKAAEENKDLLIDFTGSDWCPPCKDLSARILSQESFKAAASKNYILVELDFPNDKSKMAAETIAQNEKLSKSYGIEGFPTILLTDAQGRPFGQTGHRQGTPEEYLQHLAGLQESKTARDESFAAAEKAKGVEKAKALYAGLKAIPADHIIHYEPIIKEITKLDPEDASGMIADQKKKAQEAEAAASLQGKMGGLEREIGDAMQGGDIDKAVKLVDGFVEAEKLEGAQKQRILSIKINLLMEGNDIETVEKTIDEIIAVDPKSPFAEQLESFKKTQLQEIKKQRAEQEKTEEKE